MAKSAATSSIGPLEREGIGDQAFRILRENILKHAFSPGQRLNPNELAARLGVSITPVKEAVKRLALEGLVEIRPRSGTFVSPISLQELRETFELRAALECLAAEKIVGGSRHDHAARFRALLADLEKPVKTARERSWHEQKNAEFHQLIIDSAGNQKLRALYQTLHTHIAIARIHSTREDWSNRLAREVTEHRAIVEAIESRDAGRLIKAVRRHIENAAENLLADLEKPVPGGEPRKERAAE